MIEILMSLAKLGSVVALLVVALLYFLKKEKGYKAEIAELNKEFRQSQKDTLTLLSKLTNALDKVGDDNKDIHKELLDIRILIIEKLNSYNNGKKE